MPSKEVTLDLLTPVPEQFSAFVAELDTSVLEPLTFTEVRWQLGEDLEKHQQLLLAQLSTLMNEFYLRWRMAEDWLMYESLFSSGLTINGDGSYHDDRIRELLVAIKTFFTDYPLFSRFDMTPERLDRLEEMLETLARNTNWHILRLSLEDALENYRKRREHYTVPRREVDKFAQEQFHALEMLLQVKAENMVLYYQRQRHYVPSELLYATLTELLQDISNNYFFNSAQRNISHEEIVVKCRMMLEEIDFKIDIKPKASIVELTGDTDWAASLFDEYR